MQIAGGWHLFFVTLFFFCFKDVDNEDVPVAYRTASINIFDSFSAEFGIFECS